LPCWLVICVLLYGLALPAFAADDAEAGALPTIYPIAIFSFKERGAGVTDYGVKISDILTGLLSANPDLLLVDRVEMDKMLAELHLSAAGVGNPAEAVKVGQLTGARLIITGSVFTAGKSLYIIAKVIGTETTRVVAETARGAENEDIGNLTEKLAEQISQRIAKDVATLVPAVVQPRDAVANLNKKLGDAARPAVSISINERQIGQPTIDPAAQTEMEFYCKETGFTVVENSIGVKPVPIKIVGEGMSEFAARFGDLVSMRARLEVKAINPETDEVIAVDRQTVIVVDMTEQIAGKNALQQAAAMIAERMLPKLVAKPDEKK